MADLAQKSLLAAATESLTGLTEHGTIRVLSSGPFRVDCENASGVFQPVHEARAGGLIDVGIVGTKANIVNIGDGPITIRVGQLA